MTTLYKLNNSNQISWWKIEQSVDEHNNLKSEYTISWGQNIETINNTTRCNNYYPTTTPERATLEITSLIKEQIDRKGYSKEIPTSVPDRPMLAQTWDDHLKDSRKPFESVYLQPKLDGLRCISTHNKMLTRRAETIVSCPHISYILEHLDPQYKLDGELFIGGVDLQTIQSFVHRNRPHRLYKQIEYHVFDLVDLEMPFKERYNTLRNTIKQLMVIHADLWQLYSSVPEKLRSISHLPENCPIKLVTTTKVDCNSHSKDFLNTLKTYHKDAVEVGYEGAMVRNPESPYELNYRSPNLLKYKARMDAEFEIIDINEGYGKTGIFVCKTEQGSIFEATPSWPTDKKRFLLRSKEKYIGKWLTVEFEKYSKDGIPLKPTGKSTRIV